MNPDVWESTPHPGDSLFACGRVTNASGDLMHILASGTEFTYTIEGATVSGIGFWDSQDGHHGGTVIEWAGGWLHVWGDTTSNATYAHPATFRGNTHILAAPISRFWFLNGVPENALQIDGQFAEGVELPRVSADGVGYPFQASGDMLQVSDSGLLALGYAGTLHLTLQVFIPDPVEPATWGRIKALYSNR